MRDINNCFTKKEKKKEEKESVNTRNKTKGAGNRKITMFTQRTKHTRGARSFIFPVKTL